MEARCAEQRRMCLEMLTTRPRLSARSVEGALSAASECPAVRPRAHKCSPARTSRSRPQGDPDALDGPAGSALPGGRAKRGSLRAADSLSAGAFAPMESPEPPAASMPSLPAEGARSRRGARSIRPACAPMDDGSPGPAEGALAEPEEFLSVPPRAQKGGPARCSGSQRKKGGPEPQDRPTRSAPPGGRAKRASLLAEDPTGDPEPPAADSEAPRPGDGPRGRRGARSIWRPPPTEEPSLDPEEGAFAQHDEGPAVLPKGLKCGPAGTSRSLRKKRDPYALDGSRESTPPRGRAKRGSLPAEDPPPAGAPAPTEDTESPAASEPPALPPEGARSRRGARSVRERRSPPAPAEATSLGPPIATPGTRGTEAAPAGATATRLRAVLKKLKLKQVEISEAAEAVNAVANHLLKGVQKKGSVFKGVLLLSTGSYYEYVKVSSPNEFDIMFTLEAPRVELEEYGDSGEHYFVKCTKRMPQGNPLEEFLEGDVLSASKMLSKFRTIIEEEIRNIKDTEITMEMKKPGSPAVTLLIGKPQKISVDIVLSLKMNSSWPASTQNGLPIKNWRGGKLRTELRRKPFYLVPKHAKEGDGYQEETWRLSFSNVEKYMLLNHGQKGICCENGRLKCCRKDCLKLMKYLLEQLKKKFEYQENMDKFCSYHMKTTFLHVCTQNPDDSQWQTKNLASCFDSCLTFFLQSLKTESLQHFFIPGANLFSEDRIDQTAKGFLAEQIENERKNGFPILDGC